MLTREEKKKSGQKGAMDEIDELFATKKETEIAQRKQEAEEEAKLLKAKM